MFYEQLEILCQSKGITPTQLVRDEFGLSSSKVTAWKNGSIPKAEMLLKIAEYFNVTVGALFDGSSTVSALTDNEQEVLKILRSIPDERSQIKFLGRIEPIAQEYLNNNVNITKDIADDIVDTLKQVAAVPNVIKQK